MFCGSLSAYLSRIPYFSIKVVPSYCIFKVLRFRPPSSKVNKLGMSKVSFFARKIVEKGNSSSYLDTLQAPRSEDLCVYRRELASHRVDRQLTCVPTCVLTLGRTLGFWLGKCLHDKNSSTLGHLYKRWACDVAKKWGHALNQISSEH